jgi:polysaccharide deacetylase 2 family uncharacterized protein YibQ
LFFWEAMTRVRITRLPPLLLGLGGLAVVMAGLGTAVSLWTPSASASRQKAPATDAVCHPDNPCLAIVIDDVGRDLAALKQLLSLRLDLTYSVLPDARHTAAALEAIRAHKREILLHLPMAPLDPGRITDEKVVLGRDQPLEEAIDTSLEQVPDAVGVNNHMGSALCQNPEDVRRILRRLRQQGLWFLDSRTSSASVFCQQAAPLGVPCIERDVFLDHPPRPGVLHQRLVAAVRTARQRGWAVAIAHPHPATVRLLRKVERRLTGVVQIRRLSVLFTRVSRMALDTAIHWNLNYILGLSGPSQHWQPKARSHDGQTYHRG